MKDFEVKIFLIILFLSQIIAHSDFEQSNNFVSEQNFIKPNIESMTLDEKIAQMIMVRVSGKFYNQKSYSYKKIKDLIKNHNIGGIIMFYADIHGAYHNISLFQQWSKIPLLVGSDYERGLGQWMDGGTLFPSNMAIAATQDVKNAYTQGEIIAKEAKALGVHAVFAPVMDINSNPSNPIINLRSYSDLPSLVSSFGVSFIEGIQSQGIHACAKHFPGHGDTDIDSHTSLPIIKSSKKHLLENELAPFQSAIKNKVKMIMAGHLVVPALDSIGFPATHSNSIISKLLKNEMGFNGLVITDAMEMGALNSIISNDESVLRAIESGADIILLPIDEISSIQAIKSAVKSGRISINRINTSVSRILSLKEDSGLFDGLGMPDLESIGVVIGSKENISISKKITSESITLAMDKNKNIPIMPELDEKVCHLILSTDDNAKDYLKKFSNDINRTINNATEIFVNYKIDKFQIKKIVEKIQNHDLLIISSLVRIRMDKGESTIDKTHLDLLKSINSDTNIKSILVSFGSPYFENYNYFDTLILTYGYGPLSVEAVGNAIFGRANISGRLPVTLSKELKRGHGLIIKKRLSEFSIKKKYNMQFAESIIEDAINDKIFPGAQIFISKGENIILNKGFGKLTYESESAKVDVNTIYDIASITKVMSTVPLVMKLEEKKRLSINNYVTEYFPSFKGKHKEKVKVLHLLTHTSGISSYVEYFNNKNIFNEKDIIDDILKRDLLFEPAFGYKYSDLGFILLKNIIEKANRTDFEKLASNWIYRPLNMKNTYFNPDADKIIDIAPTEYDSVYRNKLIKGVVHDENTYMIGGVSGHAGLFSNAQDIAIFAKLFLNNGLWLGKRHFNKSTVQRFLAKQNLSNSDYALGWDTPALSGSSAGDFFSNQSFGHLGFTGTSVWVDRKNEIIIILLTNRTYPSRKNNGIYKVRRKFHNEVMKTLLSKNEAFPNQLDYN